MNSERAGMDVQIRHTVRDEILELSLEGKICHANAASVKADAERIAAGQGRKLLLVDIRGVERRPGLGEAYFMVKEYPAAARLYRIAVIDHPEHRSFSSFHETVCVNDGFRVRHFHDTDEARHWLLGNT